MVSTKISWRRLEHVFWRCKTKANIFVLIKTSSEDEDERRLQDVFKTSSSRRMFAGTTYKTFLHKNQFKPQKQIKLKVAVESKSYYLKILSGADTDNNWSRQMKNRYRNYQMPISRISHQRCSVKKSALKNLANFIRKVLCWGHFLKQLRAFRPAISLKRDSITGVCLWSLRNF